MAADPIKMGIGGYYTFYAMAGNIDPTYAFNGSVTASTRASPSFRKVKFTSSVRRSSTNGTSVGFERRTRSLEPEHSATGAALQIDEAFLFAFGDWGRVELGARDAATYRMYYGTPSALIGWGAIQHNHNWANSSVIANNKAYGRTMATTITPTWRDVNRINYFTPRFQGLQIGVGYAPKMNGAANNGAASPPARPVRRASAAISRRPTRTTVRRRTTLPGSVRHRRQLSEQVRRPDGRAVRRIRLCPRSSLATCRSRRLPTW